MTEIARRLMAALLVAGVGFAWAADQTILGKLALIRDPDPGGDATRRKIVVRGVERQSPNAVVGDPRVSGGATLTIFADGAAQVFGLPQNVDPVSGRSHWLQIANGFDYRDAGGTNSAIRSLQIKRSASGRFVIKIVAVAKHRPITLLPPNPGESACVHLAIIGGDSYHVLLPPPPDSAIAANDATAFLIRNAVIEGLCPPPTTTITGTITTTSTSSTSTSVPP